MSDFNAEVIEQFRANRGAVGGHLAGTPLVLLTHRGARSGRLRTTPLGYYDDGDRLILFASNLGSSQHPAWFHNVVAHPRVTVELGDERFEAEADVLRGADRAAAWDRVVEARPFLVEHQKRAGGREIPLVGLRRLPDQ